MFQAQLLSQTHEAIFSLDTNYLITYWNKAAEKIFGWRKEEVLGKNSRELLKTKFEGSSSDEAISNLWKEGSWEGEAQYLRKNGTYSFADVNATVLKDANGKELGIVIVARDITKRKKAEEEVKLSQKLLQDVINGYPNLIFVKDVEGRFITINNKLEELLGITNEELKGKTDYDIFPREEAECYRENDRKVLEKGESIQFEEEADLIDGHHIFIANKFPIYDINGKPYGVASISTDITERKQLEKELREARANLEKKVEKRTVELEEAYGSLKESELKYRTLTENSPDLIIRLDKDFKYNYINYKVAELQGKPPEFFIGKTMEESGVPEESAELWRSSYRKVLETGKPNYSEYEYPTLEGVKSFETIDLPEYNKKGEIEHILSITRDITKRKKAEEVIEGERQRFYDVMEMLPAYLVLLTQDYHVAFANRFFRERFGEDCGQRCFEYLFGLTEPCENCETYKVLKTGAPHHWEWTGPDDRNYDIYDFPFKDTDGSLLIMEFGIDITERKKAEEQLKETITELERSNNELQSFAYITSHDLQEPLRSIASYAQLIEKRYKGQLDSDADDFLDFMVDGATRLQKMIKGLMEYSRVGTKGEEFKDFNAEEALKHALSNLKSSIDECHADVISDSLPVIHADESQISRVFQNLIR